MRTVAPFVLNLNAVQLACMTSKTAHDAFPGAQISIKPQRSIHSSTDKSKRSTECTVAPRTREGLKAHKDNRHTYPGGKVRRKAMARLALRQRMHDDKNAEAHTMPGSMAA